MYKKQEKEEVTRFFTNGNKVVLGNFGWHLVIDQKDVEDFKKCSVCNEKLQGTTNYCQDINGLICAKCEIGANKHKTCKFSIIKKKNENSHLHYKILSVCVEEREEEVKN